MVASSSSKVPAAMALMRRGKDSARMVVASSSVLADPISRRVLPQPVSVQTTHLALGLSYLSP